MEAVNLASRIAAVAAAQEHLRRPRLPARGCAAVLTELAKWRPPLVTIRLSPCCRCENMSVYPDKYYFAMNVLRSIITSLFPGHWFVVIARNSIFITFSAKPSDIKKSGQACVRYSFIGAVRKASGKVPSRQLTLKRLRAATPVGGRVRACLTDIFSALQDESRSPFSQHISQKCFKTEIELATRARPENLTGNIFLSPEALPHLYLATREGIAER